MGTVTNTPETIPIMINTTGDRVDWSERGFINKYNIYQSTYIKHQRLIRIFHLLYRWHVEQRAIFRQTTISRHLF